MINLQCLELPMSRTNFHGPKDVQAIDVRLYNHIDSVIECSRKLYSSRLGVDRLQSSHGIQTLKIPLGSCPRDYHCLM